LSSAETSKATRYRFPIDQKMSATAHGLKRLCLGLALDKEPDELIFSQGKFGKPFLVNNKQLKFSLTHSMGVVAFSVKQYSEIGVDYEQPRPQKYSEFAHLVLSDEEFQKFINSTSKDRLFTEIWSQKEAICKASGYGLDINFSHFSAGCGKTPILCPRDNKSYFVESIPLYDGFLSLACHGEVPENHLLNFDEYIPLSD